ncbi:baeRF7 domain-containing protein [Pararcticibacter amylolyticus]|uniref:Uncharacterized protein n=1 Tax=Pararcticibacter amylolyticus TaxID=2173175 RepID=A0A2U2PKW0_9SPHI|nr:hypothetical protein [Pararcticibacter amylolyticus]PWG82043.1 hypothetical protein DDR33_03205 [Pararcticibacter amylolyticus]
MIISREELSELANYHGENCVTVFMPAHSSGYEVNEKHDVITFKNILQKARQQMEAKGLDQAAIEKVLKKGFSMVDDEPFWKSQLKGLAVFLSESFFKVIKLPISVKETLIVNNSFYIAPLPSLMKTRKPFYVLVLSKHDAQFYEADSFEIKKLEVEGLPNGMDDVIRFEEKGGRQLMRRAGASTGAAATVGANFHGHGAGLSDDDEYLEQYLKEVDQTLWKEVLSTQNAPLIVAAVDYVLAAYKRVTKYKGIWTDHLTGNFEYEEKHTLYEKAKAKMDAYFKEDTRKALQNYYNNSAKELTSSIPGEVIPASYYGQVSDLFVLKDAHIWGQFNESDNQLTVHDSEQPGDVCLIDKSIMKTIMNGGEVHILEKERMPADSKVAAFFRYSA